LLLLQSAFCNKSNVYRLAGVA